MPAPLNLEFERVLFPCLLDAHNRYAGAEYVSGREARPRLHQKGLLERSQAPFIQASILQTMERLLVDRDGPGAIEVAAVKSRELLAGEVRLTCAASTAHCTTTVCRMPYAIGVYGVGAHVPCCAACSRMGGLWRVHRGQTYMHMHMKMRMRLNLSRWPLTSL